jgi:hypothetical protein
LIPSRQGRGNLTFYEFIRFLNLSYKSSGGKADLKPVMQLLNAIVRAFAGQAVAAL